MLSRSNFYYFSVFISLFCHRNSKTIFFIPGITILKRQRRRRRNPHVCLHKDPPWRIRRPPPLAFLPHCLLHPLRPKRQPRQGLQHRRELRSWPNVEELPKTIERTRRTRLWLPKVCLPWDVKEKELCQRWRHVFKG